MRKTIITLALIALMVAALNYVWNKKPIVEVEAYYPWGYVLQTSNRQAFGMDMCYSGETLSEESTTRCKMWKHNPNVKNEAKIKRSVKGDRMDTGMRVKTNTREYGVVGSRQLLQGVSTARSRNEIHKSPRNILFQ